MKIDYLVDTPHLVGQLVPGLLEHWRPLMPDDTAEARMQRFRSHMNREALPVAWLAHDDEQAMGTAALRVCDLPGREVLSPWLGGVYVAPRFRRRGIASALCRTVEERARELGFDRLYLFTLDQRAFYEQLGWRTIERTVWKGRDAELMIKRLGRPRAANSR